jgi:hypothetical protein
MLFRSTVGVVAIAPCLSDRLISACHRRRFGSLCELKSKRTNFDGRFHKEGVRFFWRTPTITVRKGLGQALSTLLFGIPIAFLVVPALLHFTLVPQSKSLAENAAVGRFIAILRSVTLSVVVLLVHGLRLRCRFNRCAVPTQKPHIEKMLLPVKQRVA